MDEQIEKAVEIVFNPTANGQELRHQALEFLQQVKESPDGWQVCLPLFTRSPKPSEVVRLFALDNVNVAIHNRYFQPNEQQLTYIRSAVMDYVRQEYTNGSNNADSSAIQNKLSQTLTYLFTMFYTTSWTNFFDELLSLTSSSPQGANGQVQRDSLAGVVFVLRMMVSIHDEIADVLLARTNEEQKRNAAIKDFVRDQDVRKLVAAWLEILSQWRGVSDDIVEMTLKVISRWVSWIDISLVVNQTFLGLLFQFLAGEGVQSAARIRYAAIETLTEVVGKKMKGEDKLSMILFLNLTETVSQMVSIPALQDDRGNYDTETAEAVAKLVNTVFADLVRILDTDPNSLSDQDREKTENLLTTWLPMMLRFFSDEYDEISVAVLPSLSDLLSYLKKEKKNTGTIIPSHQAMLKPALDAVVKKMKYDETSGWGEEGDQTDEAEFLELRKRLKTLQDSIAIIDENLYREGLAHLVADIFQRLQQGSVDWRDLDLALYEMFQFGEVAAKAGGIYQQNVPNGPSAEILVEMMAKMMDCGLSTYQHPAIKLLFMEISVRYASFFEHRKQYIGPALEAFVLSVHDTHVKVRRRSWYLFQRFIKILRNDIGAYAETVLNAISDLLVIEADIASGAGDDDDEMSSDDGKTDATFESQLHLFEAVGALSASESVPSEKRRAFVHTVLTPIFRDMESNLQPAKSSDARAVLQIHHDIMAMGTLSRGLTDGNRNGPASAVVKLVSDDFAAAAEATVTTLENLREYHVIRESCSFAFSRLVGVLGTRILPLIPRWIEGLLADSSTKEEMSVFLRLLDQLIHGFKTDIFDYLNRLLSPLLGRVFTVLSVPTTGTDDELQTSELRKEYLNFFFVVLNNNLGHVFVSELNQGNFEDLLQTIEYFAKDISDAASERLAFSLMIKMSQIWGGPEDPATIIALPPQPNQKKASAPPQPNGEHSEKLPGFDRFMMERFSGACWNVPANSSFNSQDAQAKLVLIEVASLQKTIYGRTGADFIAYLRDSYFPSINLPPQLSQDYLAALQSMDIKNFRKFFQVFQYSERGILKCFLYHRLGFGGTGGL